MRPQQTAVEWLDEIVDLMIKNGGCEDLLSVRTHIQKAKEMEKEQISRAWQEAEYASLFPKKTGENFLTGEQYYNETYGKTDGGRVLD